jgi:mannitol/fructose-specific phosphotransferase system IIA component (Ntr-type)
MKLSTILREENILQLDAVSSRSDLLKQMTDLLVKNSNDLPDDLTSTFLPEIELREKQGGTGVGSGVAFPHARINGLERPLIALATVADGIDFDAPDNEPANIVFLFLFPAKRVELGVKIYASCSRFLMKEHVRNGLLQAQSASDILSITHENDMEIDAPVIALDLMRNKRFRIAPETPLHEATQLMHRNRTLASPVLNKNDEIVGELNCNQIFERELPDYIKHLHSVPHITDFKPFQHYFSEDGEMVVGEFMNECKNATINEDATMLEIVFLLSVKKHPLLYVCRDNKLLGVIDAVTVADKIFNM